MWNARNILKDMYEKSIDVEKVREIADQIPSYDYSRGKSFAYKQGDISIKNLTFGYGEKLVFDKLSLKLEG
jgi:ABC-type bacteriocin/lantibiotic exporter with double-glycine peptidase domain